MRPSGDAALEGVIKNKQSKTKQNKYMRELRSEGWEQHGNRLEMENRQ